MSMKQALEKYLNKDINVVMNGSGGAMPGTLIFVGDSWFIMDTRWSSKQWFDVTKVTSFWANEDKPSE